MNQFVTIFVSAGAGLISGVILHWLRIRLDPSARLVWAVTHQAAFPIESPNRIAVTRTVLIANGGRAAAEDVENSICLQTPAFYCSAAAAIHRRPAR